MSYVGTYDVSTYDIVRPTYDIVRHNDIVRLDVRCRMLQIVCDIVRFYLHIVHDIAYGIACDVSIHSERGVQIACALAWGQRFA